MNYYLLFYLLGAIIISVILLFVGAYSLAIDTPNVSFGSVLFAICIYPWFSWLFILLFLIMITFQVYIIPRK